LIVLWGFLAFIFILNNKHSLFLIYSWIIKYNESLVILF
jgi:hypothetical protein